MAFYRKSGGSNVAPSIVKRRSGSGWANVQTIKRRSGGTWVTVWAAYTPISGVTITPSSASGTTVRAEPAPATAAVNSVGVTVAWSGGNPGATVTWAQVSGDTLPTVPPGASGYFGAVVNKNGTKSAVYRATVSDGVSSSYKDCPVSLQYVTNL